MRYRDRLLHRQSCWVWAGKWAANTDDLRAGRSADFTYTRDSGADGDHPATGRYTGTYWVQEVPVREQGVMLSIVTNKAVRRWIVC